MLERIDHQHIGTLTVCAAIEVGIAAAHRQHIVIVIGQHHWAKLRCQAAHQTQALHSIRASFSQNEPCNLAVTSRRWAMSPSPCAAGECLHLTRRMKCTLLCSLHLLSQRCMLVDSPRLARLRHAAPQPSADLRRGMMS